MVWEVHIYEPGAIAPARSERFDGFAPAFARGVALKNQRPNGWHVHVRPPPDATEAELGQLHENGLVPG